MKYSRCARGLKKEKSNQNQSKSVNGQATFHLYFNICPLQPGLSLVNYGSFWGTSAGPLTVKLQLPLCGRATEPLQVSMIHLATFFPLPPEQKY